MKLHFLNLSNYQHICNSYNHTQQHIEHHNLITCTSAQNLQIHLLTITNTLRHKTHLVDHYILVTYDYTHIITYTLTFCIFTNTSAFLILCNDVLFVFMEGFSFDKALCNEPIDTSDIPMSNVF